MMYYYKNGVTTFLWKETIIVIILICVIFIFLGIFTVRSFNKVIERYYPNDLFSAESTLNRIRLWSDFLSVKNDKICLVYNHTCYLLASIELLKGNDRAFLRELDGIKKEDDFELKSFMLALYYRSKGNGDMAVKEYSKYIQCSKHEKDIQIIMCGLFDGGEDFKSDDLFLNALNTFKNPAIIKLFVDNELF